MAIPPEAPQRPQVLVAHGDERQDPWYWLREREDPEVLAYLQAENAYTDEVLAPLNPLRDELFEEMKARIKETDMSVPTRRGPWWYYTRTEEGKDYAIHCRRPARGPDELPPAGEPGDEEQVLLDENALAAGSEYFAVGSAAVSHDHLWLAYTTDRAGDERYELRFKPLDAETSPATAAEMVPEVGYGLAWSAAGDQVFYVRLDDALRPYQLWRHRLGGDPEEDVLVYEEEDRRFALGTGSTRDEAFVLVGLHSTNTTEWRAIPAGLPLSPPAVVMPRREGVEYALDHLTPATGGPGWFLALTNEDAQDFRVLAAPDTAPDSTSGADRARGPEPPVAPDAWVEVVPHRPGVRVEDVDAFARALVLSERTDARRRCASCPWPTPGRTPSAPTRWPTPGSSPPSTAPRRPGSDPTPRRIRPRCA